MWRWMVGGVMCSAILVQGAGSGVSAEPKEVTYSELMVKPGDPALSKELAAKLAMQKGLFAGSIAVGAEPTGTPASGATNCRPPLTAETLQQMLENLGYSPQAVKLPTGETKFMLTVPRGTWTLRPNIALTVDGKMLMIMHVLTGKIDPAKVEAGRWQKLMESNVTVAPLVYALDPVHHQLMMYHGERNIDVSPALLRQWLDVSMDVVIATHDTWKDLDAPSAPAPEK
jgi:hypothetical protein